MYLQACRRNPYLDLQVVGEKVDPLGDPSTQGLLDWLGINFDVANGGTGRQGLDLLLHPSVLGNFSLKAVQGGVLPRAILKLLALSC